MANQSKSFGLFSGTGASGASGVTSVTAGTGLTATPNPITATGTIAVETNGLVSTFTGTNGPLGSTAAGSKVEMYDNTTFPSTTFTMVQPGRIGFAIDKVSVNERFGLQNLATFDQIEVSGSVSTNCTSGALIFSGQGNGIFPSSPFLTFDSSGLVVCNGTNQSLNFSQAAFRVGSQTTNPSSATSDFFQINVGGTASGGNTRLTSLIVTVTQFSD
jgi:hypothetical protein